MCLYVELVCHGVCGGGSKGGRVVEVCSAGRGRGYGTVCVPSKWQERGGGVV